jgi:hypothetical protein
MIFSDLIVTIDESVYIGVICRLIIYELLRSPSLYPNLEFSLTTLVESLLSISGISFILCIYHHIYHLS